MIGSSSLLQNQLQNLKKTPSIPINLNQVKQKSEEQNKVQTPKTEEVRKVSEPSQELKKPQKAFFGEEDVWKALEKFCSSQNSQSNWTILKSAKIQVYQYPEIAFVFDLDWNAQQVEKIKTQMLGFLKKELANDFVEIKIVVEKMVENKPKTPYTPHEKFDFLLQENPALQTLKSNLGLELE